MSTLLPLDPDQLLSTTRSVRKRLDLERPVDLAVIRECIDVATQAPTGGNNQGWHWLVVTDPEKKKPIAEWYRDAFKAVLRQPGRGRSAGSPRTTPRTSRPPAR